MKPNENGPARARLVSRRRLIGVAMSATSLAALAACGAPPAATPTPAAAKPAATAAAPPTSAPTAPTAAQPAATAKPGATAPAAAPTVAPTAAPAVKPAGQPKVGGQSVWALLSDPVALDPHKAGSDAQGDVLPQLYESLTTFDEMLAIVPALALSWETTDPTTYVWKLRQGVKFHDGKEFTAEDVKYSVERMLAKETGSLWTFTFDSIDQVSVVDKYTVKMTTKRPDPGLPGAFATMRGHAMLPAGAAERSDLQRQAIGTGPFKLVEFVSASHVIVEKFPDYWGKPLPYLDRVTLKILPDEEARVAGLRAKQIDGTVIGFETLQRLANEPAVRVLKTPIYSPYTLEPNAGRAPTSDVRVRRAISMALDRNVFLEKVVGGNGTLSGPIAPGYGDWFIPPDQLGYKHDPEGATKLLAEAGVAAGTVLIFPYEGTNPFYSAIAVIVADQLKQVGLEVKLEPVEAGVLSARGPSRSRDYHLFSRRRGFRHDPDAHLRADFHSSGGSNPGYKNAEVDDLLDKARVELDRGKRKEMYSRIQRIILDENPHIFLFNGVKLDALQSYVQGYEPQYTGFRETIRKTWLDK